MIERLILFHRLFFHRADVVDVPVGGGVLDVVRLQGGVEDIHVEPAVGQDLHKVSRVDQDVLQHISADRRAGQTVGLIVHVSGKTALLRERMVPLVHFDAFSHR